jgi:hypothetical protein
MPWWGLLIEVFIVWLLWVVAAAQGRAVAEARRRVPKEQRGGVSIAPIIPFVPLGFWGAALLVDSIAGPWGTLAVGWFHVALGVLFVASIVRNMWSL